MTVNWGWVPYTALGCYLYLLLSLLAAKKTRAIYSFIVLLCAMLGWTGGSLMMRLLAWPGYGFWYDVSIFGLLLVVYSFYYCVSIFLNMDKPPRLRLWFILLMAAGILNAVFNCFLPAPQIQQISGGRIAFVYDMPLTVIFLFMICFLVMADTAVMFFRSHADGRTKRQMLPLFIGYAGMAAGHLAICLPVFAGVPLDVLSGIFTAVCIFRAFRKKHLIHLTLLLSRNNCYLAATGLTMLALFYWFSGLEEAIIRIFPGARNRALLVSILSVFMTLFIYEVARFVIDRLFVRDETVRAEKLREFCFAISQTLEEAEILERIFSVILSNTPANRVYACMRREDGYRVYDSRSEECRDWPLFTGELIKYLEQNRQCIAVKELECMGIYRKMKEEERRSLSERKIGCLLSLGNEQFSGFLAICLKPGISSFRYEEIAFLESVESIASMALKNAELYEKARVEARTDVMTGMLNRRAFYEILNERCREKKNPFALILINLDDFKLFNQLYGVANGDMSICEVAGLLVEVMGEKSQIARYGGKEFTVILPDKTAEEAEKLTDSLLHKMNKIKTGPQGQELNILTASCGISDFPDGAEAPEELLAQAEMAVYHVKHHGKNAAMVYREEGLIEDEKGKKEIYSAYISTIFALTAAIDAKDHYTFNHSQNVAYYAIGLSRLLNKNEDFIEVIREAALLHDIGKIGIPDPILNKPGKLTDEEYGIMQTHVENSIGIIRHLPSLNYVIPAVICHHERYDGRGYPRRVAGKDIPLSGRILCIADSFDAMVSKRSYKEPYPLEKAISIIIEEKGAQFDPELADIFVEGIRSGRIEVQ